MIKPRPSEPIRKPKVTRAPAWFWTPAWQSKEQEASEDIGLRRVRTYASEAEFLRSLENH